MLLMIDNKHCCPAVPEMFHISIPIDVKSISCVHCDPVGFMEIHVESGYH